MCPSGKGEFMRLNPTQTRAGISFNRAEVEALRYLAGAALRGEELKQYARTASRAIGALKRKADKMLGQLERRSRGG